MTDRYDLMCMLQEDTSAPLLAEIESLREQLAQKDTEIQRLQMALADTEALELGTNEQLSAAASEILALRAANKECVEYFNEAQKDLAASQAREQQLREALEFMYDKWENGTACYEEREGFVGNAFTLDSDDENRILRLIPSCLNENKIPQDTSALEAMIAKAGEVMRERCFAIGHSDSVDESIRALPGVTLEDLR